ncbi:hypothetical protein AB0B89_16980, partial [Sphaerisporangium sp. NPDC049002]|uniref:hypothetical protein n=1 Tax=Sphaerisporangium sp. NPDC049002 TaxID=3155392 RepID=UPI0033EC6EF3
MTSSSSGQAGAACRVTGVAAPLPLWVIGCLCRVVRGRVVCGRALGVALYVFREPPGVPAGDPPAARPSCSICLSMAFNAEKLGDFRDVTASS